MHQTLRFQVLLRPLRTKKKTVPSFRIRRSNSVTMDKRSSPSTKDAFTSSRRLKDAFWQSFDPVKEFLFRVYPSCIAGTPSGGIPLEAGFTPCGKYVLSSCYDRKIRIWNIETIQNQELIDPEPKEVIALEGHSGPSILSHEIRPFVLRRGVVRKMGASNRVHGQRLQQSSVLDSRFGERRSIRWF